MAIITNNVDIVWKIVALSLNSDGSADLVLRGLLKKGLRQVPFDNKKFHIAADIVTTELDKTPTGATNRDVISNMIYKYLTVNNLLAGTIE